MAASSRVTSYLYTDPFTSKSERLFPLGGSERYFLRHHISKGQYGDVFLCRDIQEKRDVCVKAQRVRKSEDKKRAYHEEAIMRFCNEQASKNKHAGSRNVIELLDSYEDVDVGIHYLVMPYAIRGDLFSFIVDLPEEATGYGNVVRGFACDILLCVHFLHAIGVYHRDIKLENFVVVWDEEAGRDALKIIDFGFATMASIEMTRVHAMGSPDYCAPEILLPERFEYMHQLDNTDVWSTAVCLFILIHRRFPFLRRNFDVDGASEKARINELKVNMIKGLMSGPVDNGVGCAPGMRKDRRFWATMFVECFTRPERRPTINEVLAMEWPESILKDDAINRNTRKHVGNIVAGRTFSEFFASLPPYDSETTTKSISARNVTFEDETRERSGSGSLSGSPIVHADLPPSPRPAPEESDVDETEPRKNRWFHLDLGKLRRKNKERVKVVRGPTPTSDPYR